MGKQFSFGLGTLWIVPPGANPTPIQVGTLQEVTTNFDADVKELYGAQSFPVDVATGKRKITGKAKTAELNSALISSILAGSTITAGQIMSARNESAVIPTGGGPLTPLNGATFAGDGGVYDYTASLWMARVESAPAAGQYELDETTGDYTFAAADAGHRVGLYYLYTATTGNTVALANQDMGASIVFQLNVFNEYRGKQSGFKFYAVVFPKLDFSPKQDDYTEIDLDFSAFADDSGNVVDVFLAE